MGGKRLVRVHQGHDHLYCKSCRNAARARTRDNAGRLRKRHFGQQRLAAALCNTKAGMERPRKMTLESALHEITLAPARRDPRIAGIDLSATRTSMSCQCNPSSTSTTSLDISIRRKPPSKILRALDLSDRTWYPDSYRAIFYALTTINASNILS